MKTVIAVLTMTIAMSAQAQQPIRIFADASLKPALSEMAAAYPAAKLQVVYGPSALLHERITNGERPQVIVPRFCWQTARSLGNWTLVSCTVSPAFTFDGFEMAPSGWHPGP